MTPPPDPALPDAQPEPNTGSAPTKRTRARKDSKKAAAPKARNVRSSRKKKKRGKQIPAKPPNVMVAEGESQSLGTSQLNVRSAIGGLHAEKTRELFNFPLLSDEDLCEAPASANNATATGGEKRGRGRPPKVPGPDQIESVERMAALGMTFEQMSYVMRVNRETFRKYHESHFFAAIQRGRARLLMTTGSVLMRKVMEGDMAAIAHVERTRLGMTEKVHTIVSNPEGGPVEHNLNLSGSVAIGLFLPPNGRDVPAAGQVLPGAIGLPSNNRDVTPS